MRSAPLVADNKDYDLPSPYVCDGFSTPLVQYTYVNVCDKLTSISEYWKGYCETYQYDVPVGHRTWTRMCTMYSELSNIPCCVRLDDTVVLTTNVFLSLGNMYMPTSDAPPVRLFTMRANTYLAALRPLSKSTCTHRSNRCRRLHSKRLLKKWSTLADTIMANGGRGEQARMMVGRRIQMMLASASGESEPSKHGQTKFTWVGRNFMAARTDAAVKGCV
ncbi:hypothetical protein C8Q79DRAFT_978054 [Trametes meyenii]|nr:hypothetical protein C8Q79DRAFT_978054 [Trametes meyenii]